MPLLNLSHAYTHTSTPMPPHLHTQEEGGLKKRVTKKNLKVRKIRRGGKGRGEHIQSPQVPQ